MSFVKLISLHHRLKRLGFAAGLATIKVERVFLSVMSVVQYLDITKAIKMARGCFALENVRRSFKQNLHLIIQTGKAKDIENFLNIILVENLSPMK